MTAQNSSHLCINVISQRPKRPQELEVGHRRSECPPGDWMLAIVTLFVSDVSRRSEWNVWVPSEGSPHWLHPVLLAALCLAVLHFSVCVTLWPVCPCCLL